MSLKQKFNHFKYRYKYNFAPKLNLKIPVDVSLELASACNQACSYCYHADKTNLPFKTGMMSLDLAISVIEQAEELGVHSLKMNYRGESTLNPHFKKITSYAKQLSRGSIFIDRLTNSNFKFKNDRDDIFEGLSNQTKVKVSFDSFVANVMETQRAGSIHELALKNIDTFYNHPSRIKSETKIVIQAVRTLLNKDEDIAGEVKRRWPEAGVSIRDMVGGRVDADLSGLENRTRDISERQSCRQFHSRMIVNHDGIVTGCCPDIASELKIGDANKDSIYTIFNSDAAKKIRESLLNGKAFENSPCKSCPSFESFKGFKQPWDS